MYSPEQRAAAIGAVIDGLRKGTPLTILCEGDDMPGVRTFYEWMSADELLSADIARAREEGFDQIAMDALSIADVAPERMATEVGTKVDPAAVAHQKNRADLRLKLLSKWDPKRYGDRLALAGEEGAPLRISITPEDAGL